MNYFQRYLVEEFAEDYSEGRISRRKALRLIASVTGSVVIANTILAACAPPPQGMGEPTIPVTGNENNAPTMPASGAATPGAAATSAPAAESAPSATNTSAAYAAPAGETPPAATPEASQTPGMLNATVSADDPAVTASDVQFPGSDGQTLLAYLARPSAGGPNPVILVCHENRGLTDHIRDVTRRLAKAGYVGLAVDLLSRQGGSAQVGSENVPGALGNIEPDQFVQDFLSGWEYLKGQDFAQADRVGMVGFCFGGGVTWRVATKMPELRAAVPYYGPPPPVEELASIQAAVLAIYGGNDARINASIPEVEAAMQAHQKTYEKRVYEGADHAFNNDTSPRYNAQAANDAWLRALTWFDQYVRG